MTECQIRPTSSTCSIALVVALFNREITQALQDGAIAQLLAKGIPLAQITVVTVPGAIEIPLVAQRLAKTGRYASIIVLAAVIRGETTHYDLVCQQVSYGCQQVALGHDMPVIFGVLTTESESQAWDRLGGQHGHKGMEAADAALAMYDVLSNISEDKRCGL